MNQHILETTQLTRRFGANIVVDNLDLQVPSRSVYGFLGPNGAGKTTTIRMLLGLIRPTAGRVRMVGLDLQQHRAEILQRVGALVETPSLYPHLSGYENLYITQQLLGIKRTHINRVLKLVRLHQAAHQLVGTYSLGMRQRLALALALLGDPDILILDEPTNGLDPAGIQEIRTLIRTLPHEHGVTVFLSSHLLSEVEQMATHIGIIQKGRLVLQGSQRELQARRTHALQFGVDQPEKAMHWLAQIGCTIKQLDNGRLHISADTPLAPAKINAMLVQQDIGVSHISQVQSSLEDLFIQLTDSPDSSGSL